VKRNRAAVMEDAEPGRFCGVTYALRFRSKGAARTRIRSRRFSDRLAPYFCRHCKGWHLFNPDKR
jgi:hypothetical protein